MRGPSYSPISPRPAKQRPRAHLEHVARRAADDVKGVQQSNIREFYDVHDGQDDRPEGDGEVGVGLALVAVRESPVIEQRRLSGSLLSM